MRQNRLNGRNLYPQIKIGEKRLRDLASCSAAHFFCFFVNAILFSLILGNNLHESFRLNHMRVSGIVNRQKPHTARVMTMPAGISSHGFPIAVNSPASK